MSKGRFIQGCVGVEPEAGFQSSVDMEMHNPHSNHSC